MMHYLYNKSGEAQADAIMIMQLFIINQIQVLKYYLVQMAQEEISWLHWMMLQDILAVM